MHITPFNAWQREMAALFFEEHPDGKTTCPACEGEGEITQECSECGEDRYSDCSLCDGDGVAIFNQQQTNKLFDHVFTRKHHLEQIKCDLRSYAGHTNKNLYAVAAESGLKVYSRLPSRNEVWELA